MAQGLFKVHGSDGSYFKARQGRHYAFKLDGPDIFLAAVPNREEGQRGGDEGAKRRKPEEGESDRRRERLHHREEICRDAKRPSHGAHSRCLDYF